jgi:hypothetical protein
VAAVSALGILTSKGNPFVKRYLSEINGDRFGLGDVEFIHIFWASAFTLGLMRV